MGGPGNGKTMIGANTLTKIGPYLRSQSATINAEVYPVAASQTIKMGDFLNVSSGTLTQALALPGSDAGVTVSGSGQTVWGIALENCITNSSSQFVDAAGNPDGTGRTGLQVAVLDDTLNALVRIYNATASSAEQQDVVLGTNYELVRYRVTSTDWFYAMGTGTSNPNVKLVEKSPESTSTEDYGWVWIKALAAARVNG